MKNEITDIVECICARVFFVNKSDMEYANLKTKNNLKSIYSVGQLCDCLMLIVCFWSMVVTDF